MKQDREKYFPRGFPAYQRLPSYSKILRFLLYMAEFVPIWGSKKYHPQIKKFSSKNVLFFSISIRDNPQFRAWWSYQIDVGWEGAYMVVSEFGRNLTPIELEVWNGTTGLCKFSLLELGK